jgi:hypothetical protein
MKTFIAMIALCAAIFCNHGIAFAGFGQTVCPANPCGDVTHDGDVTATDALAVLRKAVGLDADGNPNQPELCQFTMTSKRGTKVRTRVIGDVDESSECFTGKPFERVNP